MRQPQQLYTGTPVDQATFNDACAKPGRFLVHADLLWNGVYEMSPAVLGGTVELDRSAQHYARLSGLEVVTLDTADLPTRVGGRFTPSGWELAIYIGLVLPPTRTTAETKAVVPLGVFPLEESAVNAFGQMRVSAWDRSAVMAADLLTSTLVWPGPFTSAELAVEDLLSRTYPGGTNEFAGVGHTCPTLTFERDASPWTIVTDAAAAVGYYARFNERGRFEWGPEPDRGDLDPVASFGDGPGGLDDVNAVVTSREVYNSWTVIGKNPNTALTTEIVATVYDDAPGSPTRWNGPMKRRPKPAVNLEQCDTPEKALAAAQAMRSAELGFGVDISADVVPHYGIEPGDAVLFDRPDAGLESAIALVDAQTINLATGSMSLRCRARQSGTS